MAFSSTTATSQSLTFGPSRIDIAWDGVSHGKITLLPLCADTNASYAVKLLHVFPEDTTKLIYITPGSTYSYSAIAGEPFRNNSNPAETAIPFAVSSTHSLVTGEVSFMLSPSNTNYTTKMDSATYATMAPSYYSWSLEQTRGTALQTVASGRLTRIPPNPYSATSVNGPIVSAQTATLCIG